MAPSRLSYTVADAFTDKPFGGNPAAVIVLNNGLQLADSTARLIAREFNLSETAFITPEPEDAAPGPPAGSSTSLTFGLRWFTPRREVALCGHATLASAHVLFADPALVPPTVAELRFETRKAGVLVVRRAPTPGGGYQMQFPAGTTAPVDAVPAGQIAHVLKEALGAAPEHAAAYIGAVQEPAFAGYLLIELVGPVDLGKIDANPSAFLDLAPQYTVIIVTARSADPSTAFVSRVFVPANGIPEDPVTGSAHCVLGPYWHEKLRLRGADVMRARQLSERGGDIGVIYDQEAGVCTLIGEAVTTARGELSALL